MKSLLNFVSLHKFVENKNIFLVPLLLVDHVESLFHLHSNHRKTKNIDTGGILFILDLAVEEVSHVFRTAFMLQFRSG